MTKVPAHYACYLFVFLVVFLVMLSKRYAAFVFVHVCMYVSVVLCLSIYTLFKELLGILDCLQQTKISLTNVIHNNSPGKRYFSGFGCFFSLLLFLFRVFFKLQLCSALVIS